MNPALIIVIAIVVVLVVVAHRALQRPGPEATADRRGVRPDRSPAQAPPRPDPEPRQRGQGLHGVRAEGPDRRHERPRRGRRRRRPGPAQQAAAENALTGTLRSLFAVVENYPELKANENVLALQEQLTTTENQISFSRQHYNATVLDYNTEHPDVPVRPDRRACSASSSASSSTPSPRPRTSRTSTSA